MGGAPLFSVLIATYDRPEYLQTALDSVLAQTLDDFECIVVDDAGPRPAEASGDDRVRVVRRDTNGGQASAYNTGLSHARGTYVTFLDDDDLYLPRRLELTLPGFERAPVVLCQSRLIRDGVVRDHRTRALSGDVRHIIRDDFTPNLGVTAVRRTAMVPFDGSLRASADVEWWIRLAQTVTVDSVDEVGLVRRIHAEVRHGNDRGARVDALQRIMELQAGYFAAHPRAAAFHLERIGLKALLDGNPRAATVALARSARRRPTRRKLAALSRALTRSAAAPLRRRR